MDQNNEEAAALQKLQSLCRRAEKSLNARLQGEPAPELHGHLEALQKALEALNTPEQAENFFLPGVFMAVNKIYRAFEKSPDCGREKVYLEGILRKLEAFRQGKDTEPFSFSLVSCKGRDVQHLDFSGDGDFLTLSEGGYVYETTQGGEIYGDWSFTLWLDGSVSGNCQLTVKHLTQLLAGDISLEIGE